MPLTPKPQTPKPSQQIAEKAVIPLDEDRIAKLVASRLVRRMPEIMSSTGLLDAMQQMLDEVRALTAESRGHYSEINEMLFTRRHPRDRDLKATFVVGTPKGAQRARIGRAAKRYGLTLDEWIERFGEVDALPPGVDLPRVDVMYQTIQVPNPHFALASGMERRGLEGPAGKKGTK